MPRHQFDHPADMEHAGVLHQHDHATGGVWTVIRHAFGHSHASHDQLDWSLESNEVGIRAVKLSLIVLGATAILQVVIALASGSAGLLADTIHNFGDATTSIPLWIAFILGRRGGNRQFTYGYGRAEDVVGSIIVLVIFASAIAAGYESILKLLHPRPIGNLGWVAVAAVIGFVGNEVVANFRIRVGREINSAALVADGQHSRIDGFTSLAVLIGVLGVAVGAPILDPLVGIAITITILLIVRQTIGAVAARLLGAIEPEVLAAVEHAPLHVSGVTGVHQVRAQWIGHRILADLHISVAPELSVREAHALVTRVEHALREHIPAFGGATIEVCPYVGVECQQSRGEVDE